jgi:UrcA family protein
MTTIKTSTIKLIAASAAAAGLALSAAPALADTSDTFAFSFRYDQADLATAQSAARVHADLQMAAFKACQNTAPSAQRGVDHNCQDDLIGAVVQRMNSPLMTSIVNGNVAVASR